MKIFYWPTNRDRTTAYGQLVEIPRDVDMLVAGFSCVDFSNLNNAKKGLDDGGESGDTLRAIFQYIKRYRPAICILENVQTAPWDEITRIFRNDQQGPSKKKIKTSHLMKWDEGDQAYAANFIIVDTKHYYIPQTRQRGYLILVDRRCPQADDMVDTWAKIMQDLKRPASSPFADFLLEDGDIHLNRAKSDMTYTRAKITDWSLCRERYALYRATHQLGHKRSLTQWKNDGSFHVPGHWWAGWVAGQVERVLDTLEINYLFNAARKSTDYRYKTYVKKA